MKKKKSNITNPGCILRISSHNIQGNVESKLEFSDVVSALENIDIMCYQETWLQNSTDLLIPGYLIFRSDRNKRNSGKGSGGVAFAYKKTYQKGFKKLKAKIMTYCG